MIPNQLYQFVTGKDAAGGRLEVAITPFRTTGDTAVAVSSPVLRVPLDRALYFGNVSAGAIAGSGQVAQSLRAVIVDEAGNQIHTLFINRQTSGGTLERDAQYELWLPPAFGIQAIASFDSGANANFAAISVAGVLFPRANVQLGSLTTT